MDIVYNVKKNWGTISVLFFKLQIFFYQNSESLLESSLSLLYLFRFGLQPDSFNYTE